MITIKKANLLTEPGLTALFHCCNCFHTMGTGIALEIKQRYPAAYEADGAASAHTKLGGFSKADVIGPDGNRLRVYNIYGQYHYGRDGRKLDYDAFHSAVAAMVQDLYTHRLAHPAPHPFRIGVNYGIGCRNAGGDWNTVLNIFEFIFAEDHTLELVICDPS